MLEKYGNGRYKVGESDSGRKLKVTLREYVEYLLYNRDDSPLYLFESSIEDHQYGKTMLNEYSPPKIAVENYFSVVIISLIFYL